MKYREEKRGKTIDFIITIFTFKSPFVCFDVLRFVVFALHSCTHVTNECVINVNLLSSDIQLPTFIHLHDIMQTHSQGNVFIYRNAYANFASSQ